MIALDDAALAAFTEAVVQVNDDRMHRPKVADYQLPGSTVLADSYAPETDSAWAMRVALIAKGYNANALRIAIPFPVGNSTPILTINVLRRSGRYAMYAVDVDGVHALTNFSGYRVDPDGGWVATYYQAP